MKAKPILIAATIFYLFFAIGFLFIPVQLHASLNVEANEVVKLMDRYFGSALLALMVLSWFARNYPDSKARRLIIWANFIYLVLGLVTTTLGQFTVKPNALNFGPIALHAILVVLFGILILKYRGPVKE